MQKPSQGLMDTSDTFTATLPAAGESCHFAGRACKLEPVQDRTQHSTSNACLMYCQRCPQQVRATNFLQDMRVQLLANGVSGARQNTAQHKPQFITCGSCLFYCQRQQVSLRLCRTCV